MKVSSHDSDCAMYQYTEFDKAFLKQRAAQFRDQLERWQTGKLSEDDFRPLRLQNGWYVQRYAPMLRVAIPYGEVNSQQIRVLARVAREYDEPEAEVFKAAMEGQASWAPSSCPPTAPTSPPAPMCSSTGFPCPRLPM